MQLCQDSCQVKTLPRVQSAFFFAFVWWMQLPATDNGHARSGSNSSGVSFRTLPIANPTRHILIASGPQGPQGRRARRARPNSNPRASRTVRTSQLLRIEPVLVALDDGEDFCAREVTVVRAAYRHEWFRRSHHLVMREDVVAEYLAQHVRRACGRLRHTAAPESPRPRTEAIAPGERPRRRPNAFAVQTSCLSRSRCPTVGHARTKQEQQSSVGYAPRRPADLTHRPHVLENAVATPVVFAQFPSCDATNTASGDARVLYLRAPPSKPNRGPHPIADGLRPF